MVALRHAPCRDIRLGDLCGERDLHHLHDVVLRGRVAGRARIGLRGAILLAASLLVCGFAGTALLAQHGIWALYLCYGMLIGCGTGLGYNVVIATVTMWFPDKTGFASGVMFMGFGLGSLTLGTLTRGIIGTAGVPLALGVVAATACVVFVFLACFLRRAPENIT